MSTIDCSSRGAFFTPRRVLLVTPLGVVLLFGAVATAHAGTITNWSGLQPNGVAGTNLPIIANGTGMQDAYPMSAATAKLSIDGAFLPRSSFTATARTASERLLLLQPQAGTLRRSPHLPGADV